MKATFIQQIDKGFSSIYEEYEVMSTSNFIDISRRNFIRKEVESYLKPSDNMLEINAGSGIDAVYFAQKGFNILATDIATTSANYISAKIELLKLQNITFEKCSFTELNHLKKGKFDYIFSNYGGLNCIDNLKLVFDQFDDLLNPKGYVSLVIMSPLYPIEMLTILKGNKNAFRRLNKNGSIANVENQQIETFYYTPNQVKKSMGPKFKHIKTLNIGTFYPSSHYRWAMNNKRIMSKLINFDQWVNKLPLPMKGIGDYFMITFQKK